MCGAKSDVRFVPIADIGHLFDHLVGAGEKIDVPGRAPKLINSERFVWHPHSQFV
jgi:hypothetical protein